jgi:hypothetical protein
MSLPEYQGSSILLGQPCIIAPQPTLKDASHLSKNTSETCLEWPPNEAYDSYYSNCANDLYCDRAHICVKQLAHGEVCESDNQCLDGTCSSNTCVEKAKKPISQGSNTVHIIASVIGVALFLVVVICIYFLRRRQILKRKLAKQQDIDKEQPTVLPKTISTAIRSNSSSSDTTTNSTSTASSATLNNSTHPSINMLHPTYDSHFQQDNSRTPSMQQQQLQYQLQRQILFNKTNNSTAHENQNTSSPVVAPPPPPYSP